MFPELGSVYIVVFHFISVTGLKVNNTTSGNKRETMGVRVRNRQAYT